VKTEGWLLTETTVGVVVPAVLEGVEVVSEVVDEKEDMPEVDVDGTDAMPEVDEDGTKVDELSLMIVNSGLAFPESPNT